MSLENAMRNAGLIPVDLLYNAEGTIQRCGTVKKPKGKNGWYATYAGGRGCTFGNWETGESHKWFDSTLTTIDRKKIELQIEETRRKQESAWEDKAGEAQEYIEICKDDGFSDYLKRKRLYSNGARFHRGNLVLPLQDAEGKVWSYQTIKGDGSKLFMPGGRVKGCYFPILPPTNVSKKNDLVVICEGFATGASIHQSTGLPVVVAFNASNLKTVADSLPFRNIIIAADNDKSGVGQRAAEESGYKWVMPEIEGWDFSNVFLEGKDLKKYFPSPVTPSTTINLHTHGLVQEIADWITSTAHRPQPILSLAASLAFVAMLKGHRIAGGTDLRTNLLIMSLAPTASGKEHPQACIRKLAAACGLKRHMMGEPVSGGGFLSGLNQAGRVGLLVMDEMGRFIGNLNSKASGTYQREIIDYIIKTFSCANSTLIGRQYVDNKKNPRIDIDYPHFCFLGSTVKERMASACSSAEILDGFLNRWLVFSVDGRSSRNDERNKSTPPADLVTKIKEYVSKPIPYNQYGEPEPIEVNFTPEAWDIFMGYREKMDILVEKSGYPLDKLYSRSCEHVEKLSLTLSDDEDVLVSDVSAAINIVEASNHAIMGFVGVLSDNVMESDFNRVRDKIHEAGEIKRSQLTYRCQFVLGGARRIGEIVNTLIDENVISERKVGNKTYYKWIG